MKRLYLTVEGQTEAAFATKVLVPHLANFNVFLNPPRFTGLHRRRRGRIPQGGLLHTFGHALADMQTWLKEDQSPDARFSMMIDLYSLPNDFPGYTAGMEKPNARAKANALQQSLAQYIADARFIPYLQCHEFEALVLADPARIGTLYDVPNGAMQELCQECGTFPTPEDINFGQHSHPKYRIEQKVQGYDENVAGPLLAEDIGLAALRVQCPHFGDWLTRLEQLDTAPARAART
ncbi:MAG TPA: DUF4276 family protein [Gemmataceae bacterium]|nr:DUF4276 family protein [Pirellulales bacterium]HZZ79428.1 DUF4276 family protein [Gemmataceae bacterium]